VEQVEKILTKAIEQSACVSFSKGDGIIVFIDDSAIEADALTCLDDMPLARSMEFIFVHVPPGKTVRDCIVFARKDGPCV
jgi:hypothetical protein